MQPTRPGIAVIIFIIASITAKANNKDSTIKYFLPDSVKANSFIADVQVKNIQTKKEINAGIRVGNVSILLGSEKNKKEIEFEFPDNAIIKASGLGTNTSDKGEITWKYNWTANETYKLMISTATDSAENFMLYSGYVFLPKENKWKLIGSCTIAGQWGHIKSPEAFTHTPKKNAPTINFENIWCQRTNGSWKKMADNNSAMAMINLFAHVDSVQQAQIDKEIITRAIAAGKTEPAKIKEDIFYTILKEGTGRQINISDTVIAYYKGYLFPDGLVFDQTKEKPAVFPLKRLIRGWQIGLTLCRVGGKIKLIIPSGQAYSIRTRAAKIPPNSILVFEIEIEDAKPASR